MAGDRDDCMYGAGVIEGLDANCHYLCNSSVIIERVKFYGIPLFMQDVAAAKTDRQIARIPHDTQVLITHNLPYGILDYSDGIHYGSNHLREHIHQRKTILAHLFGHIHDNAGVLKRDGQQFCNSSVVGKNYNLYNPEYNVVEICCDGI